MSGNFTEPQEPSVQYWRDYRDDEVKAYFCRQGNGDFVAYLNWAGAAALQHSLFGLATYDAYGDHFALPYEGFASSPSGCGSDEQVLYNRISLAADSQRAKLDDKSRFHYEGPSLGRFFEVFLSRAEAYEAFVIVFGLRKAKTARILDLIQLHYVEDAITPEDLQEQEADWPTDQDIVPFLIASLDSPYFRTRQLAAELLRKYPSPQAVSPLITRLAADPENDVRSEAAETLGFLRAREAISELCRASESEDDHLRVNIAEALGVIGERSGEVTENLLRLLDDRYDIVRCFAAEALGDLRETSTQDALHFRVNDTAKVRVWACYALARLGEPLRWNVILDALTDRWDHDGRLQAVIVLRWLASDEALAPRIRSTLEEALENEIEPKILERLEEYVSDITDRVA